jgi:hypothetical protein
MHSTRCSARAVPPFCCWWVHRASARHADARRGAHAGPASVARSCCRPARSSRARCGRSPVDRRVARRGAVGPRAGVRTTLDTANRDRLFAGARRPRRRESEGRPVVLLFDDLQWCDESSAAALHVVARRNRANAAARRARRARRASCATTARCSRRCGDLRHDGLLQQADLGPLPAEAAVAAHRRARARRGRRASRPSPAAAIRCWPSSSPAPRHAAASPARWTSWYASGSHATVWSGPRCCAGRRCWSPRITLDTLDRGFGLRREPRSRSTRDGATARDAAGRRAWPRLRARAGRARRLPSISPLRRQVMHRRVAELLEHDTALDLGARRRPRAPRRAER